MPKPRLRLALTPCACRRYPPAALPTIPPAPATPLPPPAVGGWNGTVMVPEGGDVVVAGALRSASPLAWYPAGAEAVLHCDDFRIEYRPDGSVKQFYSDVTGGRCEV